MPSIWVVNPEVVKYDLTFRGDDGSENPFWIRIKKRLTVGEERKVQTAGWKGVSGLITGDRSAIAPSVEIDWRATAFARAETYIVDWSLADDKENKLPVKLDTMLSLHSGVFELIDEAITRHVEAVDQEKKARTATTETSSTSA